MLFNFSKQKKKEKENRKIDPIALIYALKTSHIDKDQLLNINNNALSILDSIIKNEKVLSEEIEKVEQKGENLYASIQIVLEAADVLTEYTKETSNSIKIGLNEVNTIIDKIGTFTKTTSNILSFINPFKEYSKEIGTISDMIFNIAEMSESAARNAGIKAYHAGEYGRGFEVIADRMLILANKTFKLTQKIPEGISKIQNYTEMIISNISKTEEYANSIKSRTDILGNNMKNLENNLSNILASSERIKNFVSMQDKTKTEISKLNQKSSILIDRSVAAGEKLASIVKTQSDIKMMLLHHMEQVGDFIFSLQNEKNLKGAISNELKFFEKVYNLLINSANISEEIINVINDFFVFNEEQLKFVEGYKKNIILLEDNERMIEKNIQDLDDDISLLMHSVKQFNETINITIDSIKQVKNLIDQLISIFGNIKINLEFIHNTSDELKELSEQTKLLSLYASIEAARAGVHQKSLSVIVSQTKELITKAAKASNDINKIIQDMQKSIVDINNIITSELSISDTIKSSIENSKNISSQINKTMDNLKELINEIYKALDNQISHRDMILEAHNKIHRDTEFINNKIQELNNLLKQDLFKNKDNIEMIMGIKESIVEKFTIIRDYEKNRYRMIMKDKAQHWVPCLAGDATSNYILQLIHNGLVKNGRDTNILPAVAKYWRINENATEWIFFLRDDVYFHDGTQITAEDVETSFYRVLSSPSSLFINMIKGAKDYMQRKTKYVKGIEVMDKYRIKFTLEYPYIPFISNLAVIPLSIIKKEMVYYNDNKMMTNPIGCGPFIVEEFNDKHLLLRSNKKYFDGEPYIDAVEIYFEDEKFAFDKLLKNEIDFMSLSSEDFKRLQHEGIRNLKILSNASLDLQYVGFNMSKKNEISISKKVRQAINYATNKEKYIEETMSGGGVIAKGIFPPGLSCYNESLRGYEFNISKARELMKEAGYPDGINREFILTCSDSSAVFKRANILKKMWEEIGIKIKIRALGWSELLNEMHKGNTEIFMMGWAADTGEPDNFLYPLFHSDSFGDGGNDTFYMNKKVNDLINKSRMTANPDKRNKIYREIEKIIVDDAPFVFLTHNYTRVALNNRVMGYYVHPLNVYPLDVVWINWSDNE